MIPDAIFLTIIIVTLLILILIGGITLSFFMVSRQRAKQKVELAEARLNFQKELRKVEAEISEELRRNLAQELHDNIGHLLTCIRIELENKKLDHPEIEKELKVTDQYLHETSVQLRLLSRSLNSDYIGTMGLKKAIDLEVERQKHLKKLSIDWIHDYNGNSINKDQELIVFRIFQEILTNILRHASAKKMELVLKDGPRFFLSIMDDGKGFNFHETINSPRAYGLRNVFKRAEMANLLCDIISKTNSGTKYQIYQNSLSHEKKAVSISR